MSSVVNYHEADIYMQSPYHKVDAYFPTNVHEFDVYIYHYTQDSDILNLAYWSDYTLEEMSNLTLEQLSYKFT